MLRLRWCRGSDRLGARCGTRALAERLREELGGNRRELRGAPWGDRAGDLGGEMTLEASLAEKNGFEGWKLDREGLTEAGGVKLSRDC